MMCSSLKIGVLAAGVWLFAGCAGETIESRRQDHWMAYSALPQEQREAVDQGRIRAGMSQDAVFIAWGKAAQTRETDTGDGHLVTWLYDSAWVYNEIRQNGQGILERHRGRRLPDSFVKAEILFLKGKVASWRTLP